MIILNGQKFAANDKEVIDSLFIAGGTCAGFYKMGKNKVTLFDLQHNLVGGINKHGVLHASHRQSDGRYWHSFATIKQVGEYESYRQGCEEARALVGL